MIKAVIFDFFGVISTRSLGAFVNDYFANDPQKLERSADLRERGDLGAITHDQLISGLAELAGVSEAEVLDYEARMTANKPLLNYIRAELKPKYKIGVLSNASADYADKLLSKADFALFDDVVVSYHFGLIKPDPKLYLLAAKRLGVEPSECVFIDDSPKSCEAAAELGIRSVCYIDFAQTKAELGGILATADN